MSNSGIKTFDIVPEMTRLDVTTQNICNLACIQCSSYSSSTWAKEDGLTDQDYSYADKIKLFDRLPHNQLRQIHFTGGEPLMTTEHKKILESYAKNADLSQLQVSYNTNGTFYPDDEVIELWKKLGHVNVVISTDAIGPAAEVLRWPTDWKDVVDNIKKFYKFKYSRPMYRVNINFIFCAQNLNLLELEDLYLFIKNVVDADLVPSLQIVDSIDNNLHPAAVSDEVFSAAEKMLEKYEFFDSFLNNIRELRKTRFANRTHHNAMAWMDHLEAKRGTNWREALRISKYS